MDGSITRRESRIPRLPPASGTSASEPLAEKVGNALLDVRNLAYHADARLSTWCIVIPIDFCSPCCFLLLGDHCSPMWSTESGVEAHWRASQRPSAPHAVRQPGLTAQHQQLQAGVAVHQLLQGEVQLQQQQLLMRPRLNQRRPGRTLQSAPA